MVSNEPKKPQAESEKKAGGLGTAYLIVSIVSMSIWAIKNLRNRRK